MLRRVVLPLLMVLLVIAPSALAVVPSWLDSKEIPAVSIVSGLLGDPNPGAADAIDATYLLTLQPDLSGFQVDVGLEIYKIELVHGQSLPAKAIRDAPDKSLFEEIVTQRIEAELRQSFPDAAVRLESIAFDYGTLVLDTDPWRPPIGVAARATVGFTAAFLGLPGLGPTSAAEAAWAFLYSGGVYSVDELFTVSGGMALRLGVSVPEGIVVDAPGSPSVQRHEVAFDNMANATSGQLPFRFDLRVAEGGVPANVERGPVVRVAFAVEDRTSFLNQVVPFARSDFEGTLDLTIEVHSLEQRFFEGYPLPDRLRIERMSADLLRVAFRSGIVQTEDVEAFFERLITRSLREAFGNDTQVQFDADVFAESLDAPLGGDDGRSVTPLVVRATSKVPIQVQDEVLASNMARGLGMVVPTRGSFELSNQGLWALDYSLLYPATVRVTVSDSLGKAEPFHVDGRDGFRLYLAPGETTHVTVHGRAVFDPWVFGIQALEFLGLGLFGFLGVRQVRRRWAARTPMGPRHA